MVEYSSATSVKLVVTNGKVREEVPSWTQLLQP